MMAENTLLGRRESVCAGVPLAGDAMYILLCSSRALAFEAVCILWRQSSKVNLATCTFNSTIPITLLPSVDDDDDDDDVPTVTWYGVWMKPLQFPAV
jgi:hypothetical protein